MKHQSDHFFSYLKEQGYQHIYKATFINNECFVHYFETQPRYVLQNLDIELSKPKIRLKSMHFTISYKKTGVKDKKIHVLLISFSQHNGRVNEKAETRKKKAFSMLEDY